MFAFDRIFNAILFQSFSPETWPFKVHLPSSTVLGDTDPYFSKGDLPPRMHCVTPIVFHNCLNLGKCKYHKLKTRNCLGSELERG